MGYTLSLYDAADIGPHAFELSTALCCGSPCVVDVLMHTLSPQVMHSEEEWARLLTPAQYAVLRQANTERSFTSNLYTVRSRLQEARAVLCLRALLRPLGHS